MDRDLLELYVNENEYNQMRSFYSSWPTYDELLNGAKTTLIWEQDDLDKFIKKQFSYGELFPIKKDPACLFKWTWSTIYLNSLRTASCHRTQLWPIDINNFDNFHNVPEKIVAREKMLDGEWPGHGCEY